MTQEHPSRSKPSPGLAADALDTQLEQARECFFQGVAHFEAARLEEARATFTASLALAPGRASVLANLGITLFRLAKSDEAIPVLQQATEAGPQQADAWACLGLAHESLGQWAAGAVSLGRALELDPQHAGWWLKLGHCQLRLDSAALALQAFDRAVAVAPELAEAWSERGSLLRELHRLDEAAACFEKAIALGADPELHGYYLAAVRGTKSPPPPPRHYAEILFDTYAGEFSEHLVGRLQYQAHESLVRPLLAAGKRYRAVLDLGCGTGLCGSLIRLIADAVDGVDVSQAMLEAAAARGVYRDLIHADLAHFLAETERRADLVLAADVFIYVGELSGVFRSVRRILEPGGCFALSVELSAPGQDVRLLPSLRYAHSESYIDRLAQAHGFTVRERFTAPLRLDQGQPVAGLYVYLH